MEASVGGRLGRRREREEEQRIGGGGDGRIERGQQRVSAVVLR